MGLVKKPTSMMVAIIFTGLALSGILQMATAKLPDHDLEPVSYAEWVSFCQDTRETALMLLQAAIATKEDGTNPRSTYAMVAAIKSLQTAISDLDLQCKHMVDLTRVKYYDPESLDEAEKAKFNNDIKFYGKTILASCSMIRHFYDSFRVICMAEANGTINGDAINYIRSMLLTTDPVPLDVVKTASKSKPKSESGYYGEITAAMTLPALMVFYL